MQSAEIPSTIALPSNHDFRPFIKTFRMLKQLTPNLLHIDNCELPILKQICKTVEKLDKLALNLASFSDYRISLTISSSLFFVDQLYNHVHQISQKTKNKLLLWDSNSLNIYNEISIIWLSLNLPYNYQPIISKEIFKNEVKIKFYNKIEESYLNEICDNFYEVACLRWMKLSNPTLNDFKNIILEIVAQVKTNEISQRLNLEYEQLNLISKALYESIYFLIYEKNELVSEGGYVNICKVKLGQKWYEFNLNEEFADIYIREYYNFCKRFILYDFPISNIRNNVIKTFFIYIRDSIYKIKMLIMRYCDQKTRLLLHRIETHLDTIYFASYDKFKEKSPEALPLNYNELEEDNYNNKRKVDLFNNVIEKTDNISSLIKDFSFFEFQSNRFVKKTDFYLGFTNKIVASEIITDCIFDKMVEVLWNNPIINTFNYVTEKTENSLAIFLDKKKEINIKNLNLETFKKFLDILSYSSFCVFIENPKSFIIYINKLCFLKAPAAIKFAFLDTWNMLFWIKNHTTKIVKFREIKSEADDLYIKAVEMISKKKNGVEQKINEFEQKIKERKKNQFPLLVDS